MPDESIGPQDSSLLEGNDIIGSTPANDVNAAIAENLSLPSARPDEGEDRDAMVAEVQEMFSAG